MGRQPKPDKNAKARQAVRRERFRAIIARTAAGRAKLDAEVRELEEPSAPGANLGEGVAPGAFTSPTEEGVSSPSTVSRPEPECPGLVVESSTFEISNGRVVEQITKSVGTSSNVSRKPKPPTKPKVGRGKGIRRCGSCGEAGHYMSTCPNDNVRREAIANALIASNGNISVAADHLGIHRQQLQRMLKKLLRRSSSSNDDVPAPQLERVAV